MNVAVIGGGVGGLTAATRLAILGHRVVLFEARDEVGGLASGFDADGMSFDGGPYILLDRPGLEWAFERIGLDVAPLRLQAAEQLYEVRTSEGVVQIDLDLARTVDALERRWPGAGRAYEAFVAKMDAIRTRLTPMLRMPTPGLFQLARRGDLGIAPFLVRSLSAVLSRSGLPRPVIDAIAIWSHIAGHELEDAPSVMAFVPSLIHRVGAFVPAGGMRAIPRLLETHARTSGVEIRLGARVRRIRLRDGRVTGLELDDDWFNCDAIVSNYHGVGTYDELVETPEKVRRKLRDMPLQSPGLCAYVATASAASGPYLRFVLDETGAVTLRVTAPPQADGRVPVRLIRPIDHLMALAEGERGQAAELDGMVVQSWWREGLAEPKVVASRTVRAWGKSMNLYRDSMNPAMTRRLMLRGRIAHRSPWIRGLYLAGASTHPGQWVSFCAISGVLAANALHASEH